MKSYVTRRHVVRVTSHKLVSLRQMSISYIRKLLSQLPALFEDTEDLRIVRMMRNRPRRQRVEKTEMQARWRRRAQQRHVSASPGPAPASATWRRFTHSQISLFAICAVFYICGRVSVRTYALSGSDGGCLRRCGSYAYQE